MPDAKRTVFVHQRWTFPGGQLEVRMESTRGLSPPEWELLGDGLIAAAEEFTATMTAAEKETGDG